MFMAHVLLTGVSALPALILIYWALASFAAASALLSLPLPSVFRNAVIMSASRGKLMDAAPSRAPLGPLSDWTVPQQWFSHFYAVGSVWNFAVLVTFAVSVRERGMSTFEVTLYCTTLVLFEVHLVRRFLETVALLKYPKGARMHGIAYVFGLSYYIIVSLTLIPPSSYVLMAKALIGETRIDFDNFNVSDLHLAINFAINFTLLRATALIIFAFGNILQYHSHSVLASLGRKARGSGSRASPYKIPRSGAFELVSCPHYLAEIIVYIGLSCYQIGHNTRPWLIVVWVTFNLALAARMTHKWYHSHFPRYPKKRTALIPYVY